MSGSLSYLDGHLQKHARHEHQQDNASNRLADYSVNNSTNCATNYTLTWRQNKLIVRCLPGSKISSVSSQDTQKWLISRLRNSPVKIVKLDLALGEEDLQSWAEACQRTGKRVFVRVPCVPNRPQRKYPLRWWLKRQFDWVAALLLIVGFSPVIFGLFLWLRSKSSEPVILRQWCVGVRGILFQSLRFRMAIAKLSTQHNQETVHQDVLMHMEQWLYNLELDRLPLIFNVLRGEMSLVGLCPLTLHDAVDANLELRRGLNALPGILGIRSLKNVLRNEDTYSIHSCNLNYLQGWSLKWDFKLLLTAILSASHHK